jgi:hypothetical protein
MTNDYFPGGLARLVPAAVGILSALCLATLAPRSL